jgi:hypothetical protein
MNMTTHNTRLRVATTALHQILLGFYTYRIFTLSEKANFGKTLRFAPKKIFSTPVRKDTNLVDPSEKIIRTIPSVCFEEGDERMVYLTRLTTVADVTFSPLSSYARYSAYKILFGGKINCDTAAIRDDSTPCPHGNFISIGVS